MKRDINHDYFEWIISKIEDQRHFGRIPYYNLLKKLYETPYHWIKEMDSNSRSSLVSRAVYWKFFSIWPVTLKDICFAPK